MRPSKEPFLCLVVDIADGAGGTAERRDRNVRILVIEDEILVAWALRDLLADLGYLEVHLATNLATGGDLMNKIAPDFAILDVNIGPVLVFPLAAELAARKIPFIFSTGAPRETLPPEWRDHPIVPKPLQRQALAQAISGLGLEDEFPNSAS